MFAFIMRRSGSVAMSFTSSSSKHDHLVRLRQRVDLKQIRPFCIWSLFVCDRRADRVLISEENRPSFTRAEVQTKSVVNELAQLSHHTEDVRYIRGFAMSGRSRCRKKMIHSIYLDESRYRSGCIHGHGQRVLRIAKANEHCFSSLFAPRDREIDLVANWLAISRCQFFAVV